MVHAGLASFPDRSASNCGPSGRRSIEGILNLSRLAASTYYGEMAFCYRFKIRIPHPTRHGSSNVVTLKLPVPFKSRLMTAGRFGYTNMEADNRLLAKALKVFRKRSRDYDTF